MTREKGLEIANLIWHIENTESALEELNTDYFEKLPDEIYTEFEVALEDRVKKLLADLEVL